MLSEGQSYLIFWYFIFMCGIYYFTYPCHRRGFLCFLNFGCLRVYKLLSFSTTCAPLPSLLPGMLRKTRLLGFLSGVLLPFFKCKESFGYVELNPWHNITGTRGTSCSGMSGTLYFRMTC